MTLHLSGHADSTICSAPPTGHGTTDEWNGFSLGAGAPCELSSMPRGNTQFYHSHLKEPSARVYQIQQRRKGCIILFWLSLGTADWLILSGALLFVSLDPNSIHPHFLSRDPVPPFFTFCCFLLCNFILQLGTCDGPTQSHPVFPESVVPSHPRFVNLSMSCKFCFLGLLEYL